jgi:hypothetical protein
MNLGKKASSRWLGSYIRLISQNRKKKITRSCSRVFNIQLDVTHSHIALLDANQYLYIFLKVANKFGGIWTINWRTQKPNFLNQPCTLNSYLSNFTALERDCAITATAYATTREEKKNSKQLKEENLDGVSWGLWRPTSKSGCVFRRVELS